MSDIIETRVCRLCRIPKPLSDFPRVGPNSPYYSHRCRTCNALASRLYRRARRGGELKKHLTKVAQERNQSRLAQVVGELSKRHGGPAGLADAILSHLEEAGARRPGSAGVLRGYLAVARMWVVSSQLRPPDHLDDMSEAELAKHIAGLKGAQCLDT